MFGAFFRPLFFVPLAILTVLAIHKFCSRSRLPSLPLLNSRKGEWFPYYRTRFRNTTALKDALRLAKQRHKDETMLLAVGGHNDLVLLPNHETTWVIKQPENILSRHAQTREELAIDYGTYFDQKTFHESTINQIINSKLNGQTGNLVPVVLEELNSHITRVLGSETNDFHDVCVYEAQQAVECQVSARVFSGLPVCRDARLPKAAMGFIMSFLGSGVFLGFLPKPLKVLAAPLVTLPTRKHEKAFTRLVRPGIEERLKQHEQRLASDPEKTAVAPEPNDFLQWTINHAMKNGDPHFYKVETLAGLQLLLNFTSIHTSTFAITHVILDLASSKQEYIDDLREEITTVLADHGGVWSKQALSKMDKLDSTMRESQRLNMPSPVGVLRRVVAKDGVTTPSGVHLPRTSVIAVNAWAIHDGEDIYGSNTDQFKPFRFAEKRADESTDYIERARQTWSTTSAEYLSFGAGRSACPGRFFGAAKVKLMLAYILMHYDFEIQEKRPENVIFGLNVFPPMKATIRIRRRENMPVS